MYTPTLAENLAVVSKTTAVYSILGIWLLEAWTMMYTPSLAENLAVVSKTTDVYYESLNLETVNGANNSRETATLILTAIAVGSK